MVEPSLGTLDSPWKLKGRTSGGGVYWRPVGLVFLSIGYRCCCKGVVELVEAALVVMYGTTTLFPLPDCCLHRPCCIRGRRDDALVTLVSDGVWACPCRGTALVKKLLTLGVVLWSVTEVSWPKLCTLGFGRDGVEPGGGL